MTEDSGEGQMAPLSPLASVLRAPAFGSALGGPGGDLLSRTLRRSTIGAEDFHGRVRNGIGCSPLAMATRPRKDRGQGSGSFSS